MSKHSIIITLAIWVIILPFLGFPGLWRTILFVLSGFAIVILALLIKSESSSRNTFKFGGNDTDAYIDNGHEKQKEK